MPDGARPGQVFALDRGKEAFKRAETNGRSCASCHAEPETAFKTWAARMPRYEIAGPVERHFTFLERGISRLPIALQ